MNCPYCGFTFRVFVANASASEIPDLAPIVCEFCAEVGLLEKGQPRTISPEERAALQQSPAWRDVIGPARRIILEQNRKGQ